MSYRIFLDDIRVPTDIYPNTDNNDWLIARNLSEFKNAIESKGMPYFISFDNDLGETMEEGKDAVKWLVFDKEADIRSVDYKVHSANSSGVRDYMLGTLNNWKKHLSKENGLSEIRNKISNIIFEYFQQAEKEYFKTGKLSEKVKNIIIDKITHGDNYTKIICDIYYAMLQEHLHVGNWAVAVIDGKDYERREEKTDDDVLPLEDWKKVKFYYEQLKEYNKNVFPIKNLDIKGVADIWGLINTLNCRAEILKNMKLLPSIAIRNLKEDIRQPRDWEQFSNYKHDLENFMMYVSQLGNRDEKIREAIFRKMFKSNTTMESLSSFVEDKKNLIGGVPFTKKKVKELIDEYYSGLELVYEKGNIMVVEVDSPRGMKAIGCNSLWCFTYGESNWKQFNDYSTNGVVYVIIDFSKSIDDIDFMHVLIKPIDWEAPEKGDEDYESYEQNVLYSMDNDPVLYDPRNYVIEWIGSEEEAKRIFNFGEEYESPEDRKKKESKKEEERKYIEKIAKNVFVHFYQSVDTKTPDFQEFYNKCVDILKEENLELDTNEEEIKSILKDSYKDLTKIDSKQMSLFEFKLRQRIKNILFLKISSQ